MSGERKGVAGASVHPCRAADLDARYRPGGRRDTPRVRREFRAGIGAARAEIGRLVAAGYARGDASRGNSDVGPPLRGNRTNVHAILRCT
jgi:hypothetical protein